MTDYERLAAQIQGPIFHDRTRDTRLKILGDKKTEELRKKFKANLENLKLRNDWLEASKRNKNMKWRTTG